MKNSDLVAFIYVDIKRFLPGEKCHSSACPCEGHLACNWEPAAENCRAVRHESDLAATFSVLMCETR